jgi:2,4-dienoyl-CoA reductase-like NADH-dependent reductase (Old Yellow Enzyme family)
LKQAVQGLGGRRPGLLLTGNVMIDRRAMTGPGGVALEDEQQLDSFREWADVARDKGGQFWLQLSHPGARPRPTSPAGASAVRRGPRPGWIFRCSPSPRR